MKKEFKLYDNVKEFKSFAEAVKRNIEIDGDKDAFVYREKGKIYHVSYRDFYNQSLYLGNCLFKRGLSQKHVAVIGDNSYRWFLVYFTMLHSQGVIVPVDRQLPNEDIATVLNHSDAEVLFYGKNFKEKIDEIKENISNVKTFICLDEIEDELTVQALLVEGEELFNSGFNRYEEEKGDTYALRVLVYTSGTTGMAKGVMLSENNIVSCVYNGVKLSYIPSKAISVLPYHHTYESAGLLCELASHTSIFINDSIRNLMKNFQDFKPQCVYLVPAYIDVFYKKIWKQIGKKKPLIKTLIVISNTLRKVGIDLRGLFFGKILSAFGGEFKKIVSGGAPISPEVADFFEAIGVTVVNGFGITECAPLISITREGYEDCRTAGVPIPGLSVKIKNPDENGIGEICAKGPSVMLGYYKNPEATDRVKVEGWFNTEDLGRIDEQGRVVVTGRAKNLIVLKNGKNIFPEEIESYILSIPYIKETAVTSLKDERGQEVGLLAHVYLDPESDEGKMDNIEKKVHKDIESACKLLPKYKRVNKVLIRSEEFEKTTTNKIKRNKIDN